MGNLSRRAVLHGSLGLAAAGYVATTLLAALVVQFQPDDSAGPTAWRRIAIRACGSWIAAIGLMMGGFAMVF